MTTYQLPPTNPNQLANAAQDRLLVGHEPNALVSPTQSYYYISNGPKNSVLDDPEFPPGFCYEKYSSLLGLKIENDDVKVDLCVAVEDVGVLERQDSQEYPGPQMPQENSTANRIQVIHSNEGYIFVRRSTTILEMYSPDGVCIDTYTMETPEISGIPIVNAAYLVIAQDGNLSINGQYKISFYDSRPKFYGYVIPYSASGFGELDHFTVDSDYTIGGLTYSPETGIMEKSSQYISWTKHAGNTYYSAGRFVVMYEGDYVQTKGSAWLQQVSLFRSCIHAVIDYADDVYVIADDSADEPYYSMWGTVGGVTRYVPKTLKCFVPVPDDPQSYTPVWSITLPNKGTIYHSGYQFERVTTDGLGNIYLWYRHRIEKRSLTTGELLKIIEYPPHVLGYLVQSYKSSFTGKQISNPDRVVIQDTRAIQAWSSVNRVQTNIPYLHVGSITWQLVESQEKPGWYKVVYRVQVIFSNGILGAGCTVEADFVGTEAGRVSANADASGIATFETGYIKSGHQCATRLAVMSAYQPGVSKYNYREAENAITELTVYVP